MKKKLFRAKRIFIKNVTHFVRTDMHSIHPDFAVFNTDKCAILIGMAELDNFPETPIPVVIDEAVKLSALYSTEKGTDFVNGILAEYVRSK